MEKNPISFLQEYTMQRLKVTPEYTVISQNIGSRINSFSIRVRCDGHCAEAIGASKKEAKLNAAMKMINLLNIKEPLTSFSSPLLNTSSSSISSNDNTHNNNNNNNNLNPLSSLSKSPMSSGINYVGKLQEFVVSKIAGSIPEYECQDISGPPHKPEFTIVCKYEGHSITAKGSSKKEAKTLAAQRMYEKLSDKMSELQVTVPENQVKSYIESISEGLEKTKIFECNHKMLEKSVEKALKNYSKLTTTVVSTTTVPEKSFSNYHKLIKNAISARDRELVIDKLQDIMVACKSYLSFSDKNSNPMALLKAVLKSINVNIKEGESKLKNSIFLYSLKLETEPIISEIAYGKNRNEAEVMAIFLIAKTLTIMLL